MYNFKKYQDLDIWKKFFVFGLMIFSLCKKIDHNAINKVLINQIIRSVTSIAGNIAEGSSALIRRNFINYLITLRKSAIGPITGLIFTFANNKIWRKSQALLKLKS